ncbi:MAG: hypothetical protein WC869_00145 [Phycisphaerae bacterium]|jgi:hypothetical protein
MVTAAEKTHHNPWPVFADVNKWVNDALRRPDSFALWEDDPKWFSTWSLGPVFKHRDSDNIQLANAESLIEHLEADKTLDGTWEIVGCSHWAVGHVDHLAFQVIEKCGRAVPKSTELGYTINRPGFRLTRIARVIKQWFDDLEAYPVADDAKLSQIEFEASLEAIQQQSPPSGRDFIDQLPKDWFSQVYGPLWRNGGLSTESQGAWADEVKLEQTLDSLGFLKPKDA